MNPVLGRVLYLVQCLPTDVAPGRDPRWRPLRAVIRVRLAVWYTVLSTISTSHPFLLGNLCTIALTMATSTSGTLALTMVCTGSQTLAYSTGATHSCLGKILLVLLTCIQLNLFELSLSVPQSQSWRNSTGDVNMDSIYLSSSYWCTNSVLEKLYWYW